MGRRFMVPLLIGCSLLVSVAALMGISHLWHRETLTVQDVQGSPSALAPYQVTGNWGDQFHNLSFTLSQGKMQRDVSFERAEPISEKREEWKVEIGGKEQYVRMGLDQQDYLPTADATITAAAGMPDTYQAIVQTAWERDCQIGQHMMMDMEMTYLAGTVTYDRGQLYAQQDIIFHEQPDLFMDTAFEKDENGNLKEAKGTALRCIWIPVPLIYSGTVTMEWYEDGYTGYHMVSSLHQQPETDCEVLDNKLYLTIQTDQSSQGAMGIYVFDLQELYDAGCPYITQKRVEPEMMFGESTVNANERILGLETIGDYLLFIKRNNNIVILETYDKEGEMLDRAEVQTKRNVYGYTISKSIWEDGSGTLFTWDVSRQDTGSNAVETTSISIDDQGNITHHFTIIGSPWVAAVCGKDSFLTLEEVKMDVPGGSDFFYRGDIVPKQYLLTVYSRDFKKILYRGELVTDGTDDTKGIYGAFLTKESRQHVGKKFLVSDTWQYISGRRYFSNIEMTYTGVEA